KSDVKDALAGRNISQEQIEITVQKFLEREQENPIVGIDEKAVGAKVEPIHQFLPGIVTMYVLFALTLTARTIVEERKKGTLERLLTTRLSVSELFFGKFLSSISQGFIQTLILLALAYVAFRVFTPFSFGGSLVIALVFACAASALGLIIASVARSADAATWIAVFFTMLMVMLGGTFFEIKEGSVMAAISRISINTYVNDAFKAVIVQGGSLADVGFELGVTGGGAAVGLTISRIIFKVIPGGK
ncbi:MAG: ABC transporter permease, partial [Chloroflexi bacterium]|nr:ABC transporter permease [Chloroflexota bacterium]